MGLHANIYRAGRLNTGGKILVPDDCTLNGWSGNYGFDHVCVVNAEGPFEPDEQHPAVLIRRHRTMPALHVVSVAHHEAGKWTMFGGNFLYTSDSRFSELCNNLMAHGNDWPHKPDGRYNVHEHMSFHAIPIHDRVE